MALGRGAGTAGLACGHGRERQQSALIGSPAPTAVERRFAAARARRRSRIEHKRELRRARIRFLVLLGVLLFVTIFLALSIWEKIRAAFGL